MHVYECKARHVPYFGRPHPEILNLKPKILLVFIVHIAVHSENF